MIIGIGSDIVDIRRIDNLLRRYGNVFIEKIFAKQERNFSGSASLEASYYAKRFAAKEAFLKALGTGLRFGIKWSDICLLNNELGKPYLCVKGEAELLLQRNVSSLTQYDDDDLLDKVSMHISLSDEYPYAQAFVVIEYNIMGR